MRVTMKRGRWGSGLLFKYMRAGSSCHGVCGRMRRPFQCCVGAQGSRDGLCPVPGEYGAGMGYLAETPPFCPLWRAEGMTLGAWVNGWRPSLGSGSQPQGVLSKHLAVGGGRQEAWWLAEPALWGRRKRMLWNFQQSLWGLWCWCASVAQRPGRTRRIGYLGVRSTAAHLLPKFLRSWDTCFFHLAPTWWFAEFSSLAGDFLAPHRPGTGGGSTLALLFSF